MMPYFPPVLLTSGERAGATEGAQAFVEGIVVGELSTQSLIRIGPYQLDNRYQCIWVGLSDDAIANSVFYAIDDGTNERTVIFNAPGGTGKMFFRQNNATYMSIQDSRIQISESPSAIGDTAARLSIETGSSAKKAISIIAATGQSANLQEWQSDTGAMQTAIGPKGTLYLAAATTDRAQMRFTDGVAPTSPNDGDMWREGDNLKIRFGSTTYTVQIG